MSHIFISYSHADSEYALKLKDELKNLGFSVWIDEGIPDGTRWFYEITKAIRMCSAVIVIMTPEAEKSQWVEREILLAEEEKKPIFPLLLRGKRFPIFINIQSSDVSQGEMPSESFYKSLPKEAKSVSADMLSYPNLVKKWRVIKSLENEGRRDTLLGDAGQATFDGAWEIQTPDQFGRGTYGPYITLLPNKYRVTFRLKIDNNQGKHERLVTIDATSRAAEKDFARKTLVVQDFTNSNLYQDFNLEFELLYPDEFFEFRIRTNPRFEAKKRITVDYIELKSK